LHGHKFTYLLTYLLTS